MTASRVDVAAAIVVALAMGAATAAAQQGAGGPVRLIPLQPVERIPVEEARPRGAVLPARIATAVEAEALAGVDLDAVGTLTADQGGFGTTMWKGTDRATVEAMLPRLPLEAPSSTMHGLTRRLLLSAAPAPAPAQAADAGRLLAIRIGLLSAMGDLEGVNALLDATPGRGARPKLASIEANARFLANDNARACALARGQIAEADGAFWQKVSIFCQVLAGENGKAALGVALMREAGETDEVFYSLIESLTAGVPAAITSLRDPAPLHLALARAAKAQLPNDVIGAKRPGVLRTIAITPNAPVGLRLEAAERAEAAGALPVDALRQLYSSVPFGQDELANPLSKAEAETGPLSRALLYRAALQQTVPTAQAEVVARALALGRQGGRYESIVRAFLPVLKRVPPSTELLWFAPEATRALIVSREEEGVRVWINLLRAAALHDAEAAQALAALLPVARLAGSAEASAWRPQLLENWWEAEKRREGAHERGALLIALFTGLGEEVPPALTLAAPAGAERVTVVMLHPSLWFRLREAAETGRVGETVLLSLLALGEGGPGAASPVVLHQVLHGLRRIGLEREARALAVEAAVAAGL